MRTILIAILMTLATQLGAETRSYGSFLYNPEHPNALFFLEDINASDSFELRKALRNHSIDTLVLASPGGSVWEGLSMAGIIFDKKLNVFVPKGAVCASACSFMFFGGDERLAEGQLGVHQFVSSDGKEVQAKETTQAASQFTVSEIIGFLNEFNTPRFVLERMFQDRKMYWFTDAEKVELNSEDFNLKRTDTIRLSSYVLEELKKRKTREKEKPKLNKKEIVQLIQNRLNEIGCNAGSADGIWGRKTEAAALKFARKSGLPTSVDALISEQFFKKLSEASKGFCPKPKPKALGVRSLARVYRVYCNGKKLSEIFEIKDVDIRKKTLKLRRVDEAAVFFRKTQYDTAVWNGNIMSFLAANIDAELSINNRGFVHKISFSNNHCSRITLNAQ